MNIAVIGAGLAGLSTCFHLLSLQQKVTLFDPKGIGGGASGISTGLLHPFPGKSSLRSWNADRGMEATEELLQIAEQALGNPVAERTGLFRPAVTQVQIEDFKLRVEKDVDAIWQKHPLLGEGIWVPKGITVYSRLYLEGLWRACKGATLVREKVGCLEELKSYDKIVIAAGFETPQFKECKLLPLKATKGQALLCRWQQRLSHSIDSLGHISPTENPDFCQIGSTYERHFINGDPDPEIAYPLKEKAALFYPPASSFEIMEVRAGVRISPIYGYRPIVERLSDRVWVFTGLGSRGLLYHALLGKELAQVIVSQ